ncbi:hypothetical protein PMZ80_002919 [Knufia obscura]|uniref:Major facilitator superfamily (MFS) profile domain-containing protein n=2 Tax=Knufia TaxID=430999 RepID=A0AAN8EIZ2_9EURO|nr:hypothetical protein PMZ80_002919 [Knufia obscura]KAK5952493.1 hypothetical protein OHC33_006537 [Knufia fluminis]
MSYDPRNAANIERMNVVDRDMVEAEREASRVYKPVTHEPITRKSKNVRRGTNESRLSTVSSSSSESSAGMSRIATAASAGRIDTRATRTRTHPLEDHRTETHRLQQVATVGGTRTRSYDKPLPNFGGGKAYPPDLPPYEDYVVEYDGPDDPLHPQNWTFKKKIAMAVILAYTSLCSTFTSSLFSASTRAFASYWGISVEVATLGTSLYVLGYAFGPLVWGPFSELKGRKLPIVIGMFGFTVFNFGTATAFNLQTFYICRFFTGVFGSCPLAVVAAAFSDIFDNTQRGPAIVVFSATVFLGPMLAPFIGGFIQLSGAGWRWNIYLPGLMGALATILNVFLLTESYPPIVLVSKAAELRRRTRNWGIHAKQEEVEVDLKELVTKNLSRPLRLLFTEPVVLALTVYMSFIYGLLYLFLTAYPLVFQGVHGMNAGVGGLPFFGMMVGIVLVASYIVWDSRNYNKKLAANGGIPIPEWRLPPVIIGGVLFSLGLFWFGWTGYTKSIHWIVPTLSGLFTGFGLLAIFICCFNYLVDTYLMFAASVIAGNTFLRSIAAAGFPLFARQMFNGLGIQYAGTLLGGFSALLVPIPVLFYLYGRKLREKSKFAPTMKSKPQEEETSGSDDDDEHSFVALAASRSRAHTGPSTTRQRTNVSNANRDVEKEAEAPTANGNGPSMADGAAEKKE